MSTKPEEIINDSLPLYDENMNLIQEDYSSYEDDFDKEEEE